MSDQVLLSASFSWVFYGDLGSLCIRDIGQARFVCLIILSQYQPAADIVDGNVSCCFPASTSVGSSHNVCSSWLQPLSQFGKEFDIPGKMVS